MEEKKNHVQWKILIPILAGAFATVIAAATPLYLGIVEKNIESKKIAEQSGKKADVAYELLKQHVQFLESDIAEIKKSIDEMKGNLTKEISDLKQPPLPQVSRKPSVGLQGIQSVAGGGSVGSGSTGIVDTPVETPKDVQKPAELPKAIPKLIAPEKLFKSVDKMQQKRPALPTSLDEAAGL